jgi:copper resistance protein B
MTRAIARLGAIGRLVAAVAMAIAAWPSLALAQHEHHPPPAAPPTAATAPAPATPAPAPAAPLPASVPPLTDADRQAAFPDAGGHPPHGESTYAYALVDRLEWQSGNGLAWDVKAWAGGDRDRLWLRSEGERDAGRFRAGHAHLLYGRAISPWWVLVAGMRQDVQPRSATWAAVGIQGLAPYRIGLEATAYIGGHGRTALRLEAEHELLVTNRLVLQPLVELEAFGKDHPERGAGAGLSSIEAGLRLRYEIRRELAPYVGVTWRRTFFGTRDLAEASGDPASHARLTIGVRVWR